MTEMKFATRKHHRNNANEVHLCPPWEWTTENNDVKGGTEDMCGRSQVKDLFQIVNVLELLAMYQLMKSAPNW